MWTGQREGGREEKVGLNKNVKFSLSLSLPGVEGSQIRFVFLCQARALSNGGSQQLL